MSYRAEFRVRYHECDAYGHLNNVNHVRYLAETALEADLAAGVGAASAAAWEARRLDIVYLRPALYGQTVEVITSAGMTPAGTLRRRFDLCLAGSTDSICRADTESVGCGKDARFIVGGEPLPVLAPLPPLPARPPGVFSLRRRIIWNDLDLSHRVPDSTLLSFTDTCGMEVVAAHGWPAERMAAHGFAIILRSHAAEFYARPALGDEIEVATWASDVRRVSALRHYTITRLRDAELLARVDTLGVWVALASSRPIRIPPGFMDDFATNVV